MHPTTSTRSSTAWIRSAIAATMLAFVGTGVAIHTESALAQIAPAGTTIGNQASATYVDNTGAPRTSTSNIVQTIVAPVTSFTLSAGTTKFVSANQQVCFSHTIVNTGNTTTLYTLNAPTTGGTVLNTSNAYFADTDQNGVPDTGTPITAPVSLAMGASFSFVECGTTPIGALDATTGTTTVSVTDNGAVPTTLTATDTTTIGNSNVAVLKTLSSSATGTPVVSAGASPNAGPLFVILDYTNSGTVAANTVVLTDVLPAGMIYVPGSGRWSGSGVTPLTDVAAGDPVGINYTAPVTAINGTVTATVAAVPNSTSGRLTFQVTIAPNLAVTVPANAPATTNIANATWVDALSLLPKGPTSSNPVLYTVLQTAAIAVNGSPTTTGLADAEPVTVATAATGQVIKFTDVIWNNGNGPDTVDVTLLNSATCAATNVGPNACTFPAGTTFQILAAGGATTLLDSNGNSVPDTGVIPLPVAGVCAAPYITSANTLRCGYPVVISATIPAGAATGNNGGLGYTVVAQGTSAFNPTVTDTVPNVLTTIGANTADITNNAAVGAPGVLGAGITGTTVIVTNPVTPAVAAPTTTTFKLVANNTGASPAIYNLGAAFAAPTGTPPGSGIATPPAGWTVAFFEDASAGACTAVTGGAITSTGATPIAPGGSKLYCAVVTVPATNSTAPGTPTLAAPGNYPIDFTITQQGSPAVTDTIRDLVTVLPVHNVTITPNGTQQTVPGGAVTYPHTVSNTGNVSEAVSFPSPLTNSQVANGWTSTAFVDTNNNGVLDPADLAIVTGPGTAFTLAPNASQVIFVRVSAPAAAGSPPNVTSLSAAYNGGATTTNVVTDTTTLTDGLKLDKYQQSPATTGSCVTTPVATLTGTTPNAPWSAATIAASVATQPGKCISYLIVGTNTTASNITAINVADVVPPNTKLELGCGAPTVTGPGMALIGAYVTGATGTVAAAATPASTALPPGATFTLQFCVKINAL